MTSLVFPSQPPSRPIQDFGTGLLPTTLWQSMEAVFDDPLGRPVELLSREMDLAKAAASPKPARPGLGGRSRSRSRTERAPLTPLVDPDVLNEEFGHLGLTFDEPTRRGVAELLAEDKRDERRRAAIIARSPQGVFPGVARFGAALAGAMMDPLNIASAFVPVVGQARFAGLVARLGTTGARATKGVIEGTVGAALVEPVVATLAIRQQRDYRMSDAIVNVALGGVLGGGLHVGVGAVADAVSRFSPQGREAALRASVAQLAEGRNVHVDPVVRAEQAALRQAFEEVTERPIGPLDDPLVRIRPSEFETIVVQRGPAFQRGEEIVVQGNALKKLFGTRRGFGLAKIIFKHGPKSSKDPEFQVTADDLARFPTVVREFEPSRVDGGPEGPTFTKEFRVRNGEKELVFSVSRFQRGDATDQLVTAFVQDPKRKSGDEQFSRMKSAAAAGSPDSVVSQARDTAQGISVFAPEGQAATPDTLNIRPDREDFKNIARNIAREAAARDADPANESAVDFEASRRVREAAEKAPAQSLDDASATAEADFLAEQIDVLRGQGLLDEADAAEIATLAELTEKAESLAKGARAAAFCLLR